MSRTARVLLSVAIVAGLLNGPSVSANVATIRSVALEPVTSTDATTNTGAAVLADGGTVVINEIHYHPAGDDNKLREFIELHNPSATAVDLAGAAFTAGIDIALDGLVIPSGGYLVFAPEDNTFAATYGFAPDGVYDGGLSNSGEKVELSHNGEVLDTVVYSDSGDWPLAADGDGPSLELTDPLADNNDLNNWHPSDPAPTPRAANTVPVIPEVTIGDVTVDLDPAGLDGIQISVPIEGTDGATITYLVGFQEPVQLAMVPEGPAGSGGPYAAEIPSQAPGELVRYRIDTAEGVSYPDDTVDYTWDGFVLPDPTVTTGGAPIFEWFIDPDHYDALMADTLNRDLNFPTVLAYDGKVYDNVTVEIRGGTHARTTAFRQSLNFDMPSGVEFIAPDILDYPIDEFALASEVADDYFGRSAAGWWLFDKADIPVTQVFGVRLQRNGEFQGAYRFQEKLDGHWRRENNRDSGEFYKATNAGWQAPNGFEKINPRDSDLSRSNSVVAGINARSVSGRTDFIFDTFDIPALISYAAVVAMIDHDDSDVHNFYAYYDTEGTELWSMVPWDLDGTWGLSIDDCKNIQPTTIECAHDDLMDAIYESPTLGPMYWARVSTLLDGPLATSEVHDLHEAQIALLGADVGQLEKEKWGRDDSFADPDVIAAFHQEIQNRRDAYAAEPRVPFLGDPSDIIITEILADPTDDGAEVLELLNIGTRPVDLSGWTIDAVFDDDMTVPGGTIILPGSRVILTDSIPKLMATYPGLPNVALVQYEGGLKGKGEKVELIAPDGTVADVVDYLSDTTWPDRPEEGTSLELIGTDTDNGVGGNWAPSTRTGGTPGARNSVETVTDVEITVMARGTTGEEQARVMVNGATAYEFSPTTSMRPYRFTVEEAVGTVKVEFLNDRSRPEDRNMVVDYLEVGGVRFQTEADTVESIGSWTSDNGCGRGFKQSEVLHCNGYFEFDLGDVAPPPPPPPTTTTTTVPAPTTTTTTTSPPTTTAPTTTTPSTTTPSTTAPTTTTPPTTEPPTTTSTPPPPGRAENLVSVIASGTTGDERARLVVNDATAIPFDLTRSRNKYNFSFVGPVNTIRVEFVNDRARPVDRNLILDAVELNGVRFQTEDRGVASLGAWSRSNGCGPGFKETEVLHCNGHFEFVINDAPPPPPPTTTPPTTAPTTTPSTTAPPTTMPGTTVPPTTTPGSETNRITVIAWGTTGDEEAQLVINETTEIPFNVTDSRTKYTFSFVGTVESVRVGFLNDRARPVDRNLTVDAIEVNGERYQTEDADVESVGAWSRSNGCGPGFKQIEVLHCNGHFTFLFPG